MLSVLKKDFRMIAPWLLTGLLIIAAVDLLLMLLVEDLRGKIIISFALVFLHSLYFPTILTFNLDRERKQMHLWLHSPRPAWQLLLFKVLTALTAALVSFGFCLLYIGYLSLKFPPPIQGAEENLSNFVKGAGSFWLASLPLGFLLMSIWVILCGLKNWIGSLGQLGVLLLYLWFRYQSDLDLVAHFPPDGSYVEVQFLGPELWTSEALWSLLLMLILFLLSTWLLDKRTEV